MQKILNIISQAPLFNGLSADQLNEVKQIAIDKFYDRGKTVFWDGDDCNGFYIVAAGKVKIYKVSFEGKEQILHIYGPGNPFGEVPVFSGKKFPASAQTIVKSHLLFFPKDAFVGLITKNPSLALNMLAVLSMRLRQFTVQVENLSLKEVTFFAWVRETGVIPAALLISFVALGITHAEEMLSLGIVIILSTLILQPVTTPWLAKKLDLLE